MLFRVFNLNEGNQNPKKHAEFNDGKMKFWCRQFWTRPDFKWGEKKDSRDNEYDCDSYN